ncbi:MAG: S46 family peptidase [Bacteroidetes bacterium]|nr:S46 family peptidase [Bacteroidota bacterium]
MNKLLNITVLIVLSAFSVLAQKNGGMWLPTELNEQEMKDLGLKISVKDIFDTTRPSIKDAIVQFGGGCTGEVISPQGLVLTNHHCGYEYIQYHSSVDNDLLKNGFWAKSRQHELPNEDLSVTFVVDIYDITDKILAGVDGLSHEEAQKAIDDNIKRFQKETPRESYQHIVVKPMYDGNKYYAFLSETYNDVRLVAAPPQSIGKFGADTDNWKYPRHTGDFSIFRIYADKNNRPAPYSPDNVPFKPKYYLPISIKELKEGDFTFIFGYPGRTSEYLPAAAIEQIITHTDPTRIAVRDITLKILDEKMRQDHATRIKYASKYAIISNAWKKWQGELKGLKRSNAVQKRREYEGKLKALNPDIVKILSEMEHLYDEQNKYIRTNTLWGELFRNSETLYLSSLYHKILKLNSQGELTEDNKLEIKNRIKAIYRDFDPTLDLKVTAGIFEYYTRNTPKEFLANDFARYTDTNTSLPLFHKWATKSVVVNNDTTLLDALFRDNRTLIAKIRNDKFVDMYSRFLQVYNDNCLDNNKKIQNRLNDLQKRYMALQMTTDKDKVFFPDANFTLRVSYGQIRGSEPADAIEYKYQTTLDGVIEKYIPDDYEFDVPKKLLDLYHKRDFGRYANSQGKIPVAFTATNHTTGGNSGSPTIDANGNLIGLNFDRQWEGTMSDIYFDPQLCRNIMVDIRYILFIIDKFADSKWLLRELTIIDK